MLSADGVVAAGNGVLDVAQYGVDPVEGRDLRAGSGTTGDEAFMGIGRGIEDPKTPQAINDYPAIGCDGDLGIAAHLGDKRDLDLGTTLALPRRLVAQIGIIYLDTLGERLALVKLVHDLQQLELPGGVVADTELAGQLQHREASLALGQQVEGQGPGGEREKCGMENGANGERSLMMAMVHPAGELAAGSVVAIRAHEDLGPEMQEEGRPALRFGAVLVEKRR